MDFIKETKTPSEVIKTANQTFKTTPAIIILILGIPSYYIMWMTIILWVLIINILWILLIKAIKIFKYLEELNRIADQLFEEMQEALLRECDREILGRMNDAINKPIH